MAGPFDHINAISYTKENVLEARGEESYSPFLVNRGLSYYVDTVLYANEMNMRPGLDNKLQFHYLLNIVRKKKRFAKWAKKANDSDVDAVRLYFNFSTERAIEAVSVLTKEQIHQIKEKLEQGET